MPNPHLLISGLTKWLIGMQGQSAVMVERFNFGSLKQIGSGFQPFILRVPTTEIVTAEIKNILVLSLQTIALNAYLDCFVSDSWTKHGVEARTFVVRCIVF